MLRGPVCPVLRPGPPSSPPSHLGPTETQLTQHKPLGNSGGKRKWSPPCGCGGRAAGGALVPAAETAAMVVGREGQLSFWSTGAARGRASGSPLVVSYCPGGYAEGGLSCPCTESSSEGGTFTLYQPRMPAAIVNQAINEQGCIWPARIFHVTEPLSCAG